MTNCVTHIYVLCPHCQQGESRIDHIAVGSTFGPWSCDECGRSYKGKRTSDGADTFKCEGVHTPTLDLLVFPPSDKPLYFVIRGLNYSRASWNSGDTSVHDQKRYSYEEHSCPTNWLKQIELLAFDGDPDPHGALQFVRHIDVSNEQLEHNGTTHPDWLTLFPELRASDEP